MSIWTYRVEVADDIGDCNKITCIESPAGKTSGNSCDAKDLLSQLDALGEGSAVAQHLKIPITSIDKLQSCSSLGHILLIYEENGVAIGYLKYGYKDLYFYLSNGSVQECPQTLCLLDFYVSEDRQRGGIGSCLFHHFLQIVRIEPGKIAYDRPSPKLLPFLQRHCGLTGADQQPNKYAIFPKAFFSK